MFLGEYVKALGMSLIAEGVENPVQANFLHGQGCDEMQGFCFYKPMRVEDLDRIGRTKPDGDADGGNEK